MPGDKFHDFQVDRLTVRDIDLKGRKIVNAGSSASPGDYVTRQELDTALQGLQAQIDKLLLKAGKQ